MKKPDRDETLALYHGCAIGWVYRVLDKKTFREQMQCLIIAERMLGMARVYLGEDLPLGDWYKAIKAEDRARSVISAGWERLAKLVEAGEFSPDPTEERQCTPAAKST